MSATSISPFDEMAVDGLCALLRTADSLPVRERPVLWLGAGASAHDGTPLGDALLAAMLGAAPAWGSLQYQFDTHIGGLSPLARRALMMSHFKAVLSPDSPYLTVAKLMRAERVSAVMTFNVDDLLDQAVHKLMPGGATFIDCVAETPESVAVRMEIDDGKVQVVKLHGSIDTGLNLFTSLEITEYEPRLAAIVTQVSKRPAIVCGYSFGHLNVLRTFSSDRAPFYFANPTFPQLPAVLSLLASRGGAMGSVISGSNGDFAELARRIEAEVPGL